MRTDNALQNAPRTVRLADYQPPAYWVDQVHLTVQIFDDATWVDAVLTMRPNSAYDQPQPLELYGVDLTVESLEVDGASMTPSWDGETVRLAPVDKATFEVRSRVRIDPVNNTSLEGLYRSGGMYCTQCEAEGFRKITLFPDRPDVLAVFTTRIEAPETYTRLLSNGNPVASGKMDNNRHFAEWHDPFPKPSYLFALVAGDLEVTTDQFETRSGRVIDLALYTEAHNQHKTRFALEALKRSMRWDEHVFGREYDLELFMIVAVDHFNMGAMENKGLNIFNSACVLADEASTTDKGFETIEAIVAHEYFHNWSGNRVTCRDWFQLSLKEGFTVFRDAEFTADMHARAVKRMDDVTLLLTQQFAEDAGPMAHPIRPDNYIEINNFYTLTVYEKGQEVVRMLHTLLGPERFRQGSDLYFSRFDGQAVTTEDFVACMAEVSGIDLTQFERWYNQAGTPRVDVTGEYNETEQQYTLRFAQSCPPTPGQPSKQPFHIPIKLGLIGRASGVPQTFSTDHPGFDQDTGVFSLRDDEDVLVLSGVGESVVPSLLRDFSAPVVCEFPYTADELRLLITSDDNSLNRWRAMQALGTRTLVALAQDAPTGTTLEGMLTEAMAGVLRDNLLDPAVKARLLALPAQAYVAEQCEPVDPVSLNATHKGLQQRLASALLADWQAVYDATSSNEAYVFNHNQAARRALHVQALSYLVVATPEGWQYARDLLQSADNMTEKSAALAVWADVANADWEQAMVDFYQVWQHDAQVVEKWLAIKAAAPSMRVPDIQSLIEHEAFSWTNPNRIRSVLGGFVMRNPEGFHADGDAGYRFLADTILKLDSLNPQIAARLCVPFTQWRRYVGRIQADMQRELSRILAAEGLSDGVYEVVSKSLGDDDA